MIERAWSGREPRAWQREALPVIVRDIEAGARGVCHAVMGAGKSLVLAEVAAHLPDRRILITAPSIALVEQIRPQLAARLAEPVGAWYTSAHDVQRVTVACVPSVPSLLAAAPDWEVWLADEAHRTECATLTALDLPDHRQGFSATPFTSGSGSLSAFRVENVRYDADAAIRDGVIVPPVVYPYTGGAKIPDDATGDVALDLVCRHMLDRHRPDGPGVVNASSIAEAESVARWLTAIGWPALAIHSRHDDRERRIAALRDGKIRALVHVSLIVEGVDLPWLRWMLLRRPVSSRVRFAQECGRALRADAGKTHAVFLDPHDLFGQHDLAGVAKLGELVRAAGERPAPSGGGGPADPERLRPDTVDGAIAMLRHAHRTLATRGDIEPRKSRKWHRMPPSAKQRALVERMAWAVRTVPDPTWQAGIARCCVIDLTRGDAARLIDVLLYLARSRRRGA